MGRVAPSTGKPALFVRSASGLVREVSVSNALFFNIAAFVGVTVGWVFAFFGLFPEWQVSGISSYTLTAVITGLFAVLYGFIFASLTSVMPRSGGDYVFTSRVIHPFVGWLESWTLVAAAIALIGFEIPLNVQNWRLTFQILGVAFPNSFWAGSSTWFTGNGGLLLVGTLIALAIGLVSLLPVRTFHRVITGVSIVCAIAFLVMFVGGLFISRSAFEAGFQALTHLNPADVVAKATEKGLTYGSWDTMAFFGLLSFALFQFIGYQFSAYIAGELQGNLRKVILISSLGALAFGVFMNSIYPEILASRLGGFQFLNAWAYLNWNASDLAPLGQPPYVPLLAAIAHPGAWPFWVIASLGTVLFNFLLCPVYVIFISRIVLAWSMDRQAPEWLAEVDPKTHSPLRAIIITVVLGWIFYAMSVFGHNPASTAWYAILLAVFTWVLPGFNALLLPIRRKDLFAMAPYRQKIAGLPLLSWLGIIWLAFILPVYAVAFFWPVVKQFMETPSGIISYSSESGLTFALGVMVAGVVVYWLMRMVNSRSGIDVDTVFQELPPE